MKEIEVIVTGKVQGVAYRDFVQKKARALWLSGFVENLSNHAVRVVAQGREEDLEKLIEHLHKGPFVARVMDVSVQWRESREGLTDFKIIY